jgi:double-strand break repair protein MRE11
MSATMHSDEDDESIGEDEMDDKDPSDVLRILITTDNHLGYMEKDPERGADSYVSFEEALEIAKQEQVDFILLGGDLFHENKPSRDCLTKCQKLLREYCFGSKPIEFEILSDENANFGGLSANFNDPNLNISIPVFSIHGNHDDPTGAQNLCAMDTLAVAGLVNYFGKSNTTADQRVNVNPVLLQKGCTKLAIYGLGAIKDERLHHMFEKGSVQFVRPSEDTDEWFDVFVIHQNRSAHGKKNYIPEGFLPDFLDLVIWGHEHECRLRPEYNELLKFFVSQPGSSVITSLSESELKPKHVGLLKVYKKTFKLEAIPLRSVRQFLIDEIVLGEQQLQITDKNIELRIEQLLSKRVEKMIEECRKTRYCYDKQPTKPLIRLKVDYTGFEPINEIRFAQKFIQKVANPRNILQFYK